MNDIESNEAPLPLIEEAHFEHCSDSPLDHLAWLLFFARLEYVVDYEQ